MDLQAELDAQFESLSASGSGEGQDGNSSNPIEQKLQDPSKLAGDEPSDTIDEDSQVEDQSDDDSEEDQPLDEGGEDASDDDGEEISDDEQPSGEDDEDSDEGTPLHKHPRFRELIAEKNKLKEQRNELQKQLAQANQQGSQPNNQAGDQGGQGQEDNQELTSTVSDGEFEQEFTRLFEGAPNPEIKDPKEYKNFEELYKDIERSMFKRLGYIDQKRSMQVEAERRSIKGQLDSVKQFLDENLGENAYSDYERFAKKQIQEQGITDIPLITDMYFNQMEAVADALRSTGAIKEPQGGGEPADQKQKQPAKKKSRINTSSRRTSGNRGKKVNLGQTNDLHSLVDQVWEAE